MPAMSPPHARDRAPQAATEHGIKSVARERTKRGYAESGRHMERLLGEQIFNRVAGTRMAGGNTIRLLRDGAENYPAWLSAIAAAEHRIDFENYIITADAVGNRFADALIERARHGVRVRLLYDWLGCLTQSRRSFWRRLRAGGVEVRCFNPPGLGSPFGWANRNHRKTLSVDSRIGFVSGLCVGRVWEGDAARQIAPWRDTGIELRGPAVADLETAFGQSWRLAGSPDAEAAAAQPASQAAVQGAAPGVLMSVIPSQPRTLGLYRLDQLIAAVARRSLWLTDAYFVGTTAYVRALCDAARDGVDVRLLVPGASDIPGVKALSRAGYRPLLEAGIRVFEWNGSMLHAKTAVADTSWARIGSSNLNLASWIGNWELDVAVEDAGFAAEMEAMFLHDLTNATEIVLDLGKVQASTEARGAPPAGRRRRHRGRGAANRLAAGVVGLGNTVGAMITNHRALGPAEAQVTAITGCLLVAVAAVAVLLPRFLTVPLAALCLWIGGALLVRAWQLRTGRR